MKTSAFAETTKPKSLKIDEHIMIASLQQINMNSKIENV